jgi:peptidoglycan-N-acetylglucosamine deacetylase
MTKLFEILFPRYVWRIETSEKKIYLTFDDGPIPEVTEWVLEQLDSYNAKATFFVVGENVTKNALVFEKILAAGHAVGNHTYNHIKGWKIDNIEYFDNFLKCQATIEKHTYESKKLFRPPYGQLKRIQANEILKTHEVVMWSVLTKDYDRNMKPEKCLQRAIRLTTPGAIVLFHDSLKARENLFYVLPRFLEFFAKKGYEFAAINS